MQMEINFAFRAIECGFLTSLYVFRFKASYSINLAPAEQELIIKSIIEVSGSLSRSWTTDSDEDLKEQEAPKSLNRSPELHRYIYL